MILSNLPPYQIAIPTTPRHKTSTLSLKIISTKSLNKNHIKHRTLARHPQKPAKSRIQLPEEYRDQPARSDARSRHLYQRIDPILPRHGAKNAEAGRGR